MLIYIFFSVVVCTHLSIQTEQHSSALHEISQEYYQIAYHVEASDKHKAKEFYQKAITLDDSNYAAHARLGCLHYEDNSMPDAITHLTKALEYQPHDAHILFNLGQCYIKQQQWRAAFDMFQKTLLNEPSHERAYIKLGFVCEKLNLHQEAITTYKKAIELNQHAFEAHYHLGTLLKHLEQFDEAVTYYRQAYTLQPNNVQVMMDLANTLNMLDHNQESLELYEKILEKNPHILSALYNFGFTLKKMGHLERAIEVYRQLLIQKPDYAPVHFSLSSIYLSLGDLERGWEEYEWRWQAYNEKPRSFNKPMWHGEDIVGRTLLVYGEQGLGDTLQFIRYIKLLKNKYKYARIIFESQEPLLPLLKQQSYIDQVISRHEKPLYFHYQISLMSLPYVLKTRIDTIPTDIPYIEPSPYLVTMWKEKLAADKNLKIGLCWQGNAHYSTQALRHAVASKSIHLEQFAPLFEIPGISIYSLQQCDGIEQIEQCSFKTKLITFDTAFDTTYGRFMDTAAVIKNLDLIITVDTSIAHLAGALGEVPVWILLPQSADWRWLLNRTDSPWYPSVRLFRQPVTGDWQSVITDIVYALKHMKETISVNNHTYSSASKPTHEQALFFEHLINSLA